MELESSVVILQTQPYCDRPHIFAIGNYGRVRQIIVQYVFSVRCKISQIYLDPTNGIIVGSRVIVMHTK
eukprot:5945085-Ditylum_brightwellii.AAC.1